LKYCVYNENIISHDLLSHSRQFKETQDGDRFPVFSEGYALLIIDENEHYKVINLDGEILFVGTGFFEALSRIYYAEPTVEIEVFCDNKLYTVDEYKELIGGEEIEEEN
jgi:hypothetical protein